MSTSEVFRTIKECFDINTNLVDVTCKSASVEPYQSLEQDRNFGEQKCLLYTLQIDIFQIIIDFKILAFQYDKHAEILKLDINIANEQLLKEMISCKNFLQRKRNLNAAFESIIKYCELYESRRIICQCILKRIPEIQTYFDNKLTVQFKAIDNPDKLLMDLNWSILWDMDDSQIKNKIEFYVDKKVIPLHKQRQILQKLDTFIYGSSDFSLILRLWKNIMFDLYGQHALYCINNCKIQRNHQLQPCPVHEISDSDSDESVIEISNSTLKTNNSKLFEDVLIIE